MRPPVPHPCLALALGFLCGACGDSEKVSYSFVSQPAHNGLGAGVVIRDKKGSKLKLVRWPGQDRGVPVALALETINSDTGSIETITLAVRSDTLLVQSEKELLLLSPALAQGRVSLPANSEVRLTPDSATLFSIVTPPSTRGMREHWSVSAHGNLIMVENDNGLRVFRPGQTAIEYPAGTRHSASAQSFLVTLTHGDSLLIQPPPAPGADSQMAFLSERSSVRFFGPGGKVTAELPSKGLAVQDRSQGLLLTGSYPAGVDGVLDGAFSIFLPLNSHHLLFLRGQ